MRKLVIGVSIWCGLLLLGGATGGAAAWQGKSALGVLRSDSISTKDVQRVSGNVAWVHLLLFATKINPAVQTLRLVPGISWVPETLSAGSQVIAGVNSLLQNGGAEILASALSGDLTPSPGVIDVGQSEIVSSNAQKIAAGFTKLRQSVDELRHVKLPIANDQIRSDVLSQANDYLDLAESSMAVMKKLPQLIGSKTPMRYFVGITNEAELRGVQGIIGEYAIIEIDSGKISVIRTGSNTDLIDPPTLPVELIGEYSETYGETNTEWQNVNLSPFMNPAAAQITHAWKLQTGESLDGIVLIDTVAFAKWAIPKVGSVKSAQGRKLATWEALADYLSNGIYFEFPTDQLARKEFQSALAAKLITSITESPLELQKLIRTLANPILEGRVVVWINGDVGSEFNRTFMARSAESFSSDVLVGFNNWTGNKMDFYLRVATTDQIGCMGSQVWHSVTVRLNSLVESFNRLPNYLTRRLDLTADDEQKVGSYLDATFVLPAGSTIFEVFVDEVIVSYDIYQASGGRTLVRTQAGINRGEESKIKVRFLSHDSCNSYRIRVSPTHYSGGL